MIPVLLGTNIPATENNGLGTLTDCAACIVKTAINGEYELTLRYPVSGRLYGSLALRSIIKAKADVSHDPQLFRVYRITKPLNGIVTVYARHIAYDLSGVNVEPFTAPSLAAALVGFSTHAVTESPFTFATDKSVASAFTVPVPSSIWQLFGGQRGSILDVYGGEWDFDNTTCTLKTRLGADNGVSIRYGKNMTDLEQDANCAAVYTGVYPYYYDGDDLRQLPERVIPAPGNYDYERIMPLDLTGAFEEPPTEEELRARAQTYVIKNDVGVPKVSWDVSFVQLSQTVEYSQLALYERVALGDTVTVEFEALGVSASARAVEIEYNSLLERYESITLGSVKSNLADTIVAQEKELQAKPTEVIVERIASQLAKGILGANGGAVRLLDTNGDGDPDELYIADNPDPAQAVKVWRFNYSGWAASENGYNGPFVMGATLTDGLLANAVTAANLTAGTIRSADGRTFLLDLDAGVLQIEQLDNYANYIQVGDLGEGVYGVKIGQRSLTDAFKALFTATRLSFYDGTDETTFLSNKKLNAPTIRTANMELTDNIDDPTDVDWSLTLGDGFNLKWIGG